MPTVAAMIPEPAVQQVASEQIGNLATVRFCTSINALFGLVSRSGVDAVIADLRDRSGASTLPILGALRRQAPYLPLILYFVPTPAALREVPDMIAVGRGLTLVLRNYEHLGLALRPLLYGPRVPGAGETVVRHVVPVVPVPFRPFFAVAALKASPRLRVGTAARWSGFSRRTLERALRGARLPSAAAVLGACTALHVAWWLDVQGWSTKHVADQMRFSYQSGVTRVLQRHFGCSVKSLRDEGGFSGLLSRFETTLVGGLQPPVAPLPL
jgi:hypothetical protein